MLINDCMTRHPVMVPPSMAASEAQKVMVENKIRHLPVVEHGKRLVGLITASSFALQADALSSLNLWEISRSLADVKVAQIMVKRRDVVTIAPNRTAERAAAMLTENAIGCLPVVDDENVVVGIITEHDLLSAFQALLGLAHKGVRVTIRMPNRKGEFARLMELFARQQWGIWGVGTFPTHKQPELYDAVIKIADVSMAEVQAILGSLPGQEIVDIREVV